MVIFKFEELVIINTINIEEITLKIQFLVGFCWTSCLVTFKLESVTMNQCYQTDSNVKQQFDKEQGLGNFNVSIMKKEMKQTADFFERMIDYSAILSKKTGCINFILWKFPLDRNRSCLNGFVKFSFKNYYHSKSCFYEHLFISTSIWSVAVGAVLTGLFKDLTFINRFGLK